jgi:hypothetical protein
MTDLDRAGLIDRQTRPKRDEKNEVIGLERRIYLTVPEVKGHPRDVKGQRNSEGTKGQGEGPYGVPIFRTDSLGCKKDSSTHAREIVPSPFTGDVAFVDAFDRALIEQTGGKLPGDVQRATQEAFDAATAADGDFMPFFWESVCSLSSNDAKDWFVGRARGLLIGRAA